MKKKIMVIATIAIWASLATYGTLAYFTYEDMTTNVITTGDIKIDLEEWTESEDGTLVPFEDMDDVMPGMEVSKIVQVKNTGGQDAWIRVSVEKSIILAEDIEGEVDLSLVTYDLNTEFWSESGGYYYYNSVLKSGETTEPLFTTVTFSRYMSNMYQHSKAVIDVTVQATQRIHNGESVFEAAGWPSAE